MEENYYDLLNIDYNASEKEIKQAYINMQKKFHPDIYNGDKKFAEDMSSKINNAYSVLINKEKRLSYNNVLNKYNINIKSKNKENNINENNAKPENKRDTAVKNINNKNKNNKKNDKKNDNKKNNNEIKIKYDNQINKKELFILDLSIIAVIILIIALIGILVV